VMRFVKRCLSVISPTMSRNLLSGIAASLVGVLVNGTYTVLLARTLEPNILGGISSLFGMVATIGLVSSAVQVSTSRAIASPETPSNQRNQRWTWARQVVWVGTFGAILWLVVSIRLAPELKLRYMDVASIAPLFVLTSALAVELGKIHGSSRVVAWAVLGQVGSVLKLVFVGSAILVSKSVFSVTFGMTLAMSVTTLLTFSVSWKIETPTIRLLDKSFLVSCAGLGTYAALTNLDVFLARVLLDPHESGQYAVLSLFYKTVVVILGVVGLVIFPKLASLRALSESVNGKIRVATLGMTAIAFLVAYPLGLAGNRFVVPILGSDYEPASSQMILAAFVAIPWTGVYVAVYCRLVERTWRLSLVLLTSLTVATATSVLKVEMFQGLLIWYGFVGLVSLLLLIVVPTH